MNDGVSDLKQFIAATISQQTSEIRGNITEIRGGMTEMRGNITEIRDDIREVRSDLRRIDQKVDDPSEAVAQAIDDTNKETHTQLTDHETRIRKLEVKAA